MLALLLSGVLISCIVSLPQLGGHGYIIIVVDYFEKWVEVMPTYVDNENNFTLFLFNHAIARLGVTQAIVNNHGSHLCNQMMEELSAKIKFHHKNSTLYYLQANG